MNRKFTVLPIGITLGVVFTLWGFVAYSALISVSKESDSQVVASRFEDLEDAQRQYRARIVSVYDGDTITADVDLGLGIELTNQKFRLLGVDTPELRGEERELGLQVRDEVRKLLPEGSEVLLITDRDKKGKYGRWLVVVIANNLNVNEWLVSKGYEYE